MSDVDTSVRVKPAEAAAARHIPETTLRNAIKRGDCDGIMFGSRVGWLVSLDAVDAWLGRLETQRRGEIGELDVARVAERCRRAGMEKVAEMLERLPEYEDAAEAEAAA